MRPTFVAHFPIFRDVDAQRCGTLKSLSVLRGRYAAYS